MVARLTCLATALLISIAGKTYASSYSVAAQGLAFAPNAGGQQAYALRLAIDEKNEYTIFVNEYLRTGAYPVGGGFYSWRFALCGRACPLRSFAQVGVGLTNAGPAVEIVGNITPFYLLRIDLTTHYYFPGTRAIAWSYPFWVGISLPFF